MGSDGTYAATLAALAKYNWDWLAADPECSASDAATIATWIATQRGKGAVYKAVLPNKAANDAAIVNFAASDITADDSTVTTAAFCSRIARTDSRYGHRAEYHLLCAARCDRLREADSR